MQKTIPVLLLALASANGVWAGDDVSDAPERLSAFVVQAGRIPMGTVPGAILNSVEAVSTPGAAMDINRSLQTFPGVQQVDEGNALFVRGGDSAETATFINGIRYTATTQINAPVGSFSTSLDPMQARNITFLNGGLPAQYGNVLSGVVDLTSQGAPSSSGGRINLGLGAVEGSANVPLGHDAGLRASAGLSDTAPIIGLNGSPRDYVEKPNGYNVGGLVAWGHQPGSELRIFGNRQLNRLALMVDEPELRGLYRSRVTNDVAAVAWDASGEDWKGSADVGQSGLARREITPRGTIETSTVSRQAALSGTWEAPDRTALSAGLSCTNDGYTVARSHRVNDAEQSLSRKLWDHRTGAYAQVDRVMMPHVRIVAGARADHSSLAGRTTMDPRTTLSWEAAKGLGLSLAGGSYHQVPDGYYYVGADGEKLSRPAMRAQDAIGAVEYRSGSQIVRLEAYQKKYGALAQLDRDRQPVVQAGAGEARGLDLFFKTDLPADFDLRVTASFLHARRTDPDSGRMASAPWDIGHGVTAVLERPVAGWRVSLAYHYAQGRPITPVVGRQIEASGWEPVYGAPYSERVPPLRRVDFLAYRVWYVRPGCTMATYLSVNNLLNRTNVYAYGYDDAWSQRHVVPSFFNRIVYFGVMIFFN